MNRPRTNNSREYLKSQRIRRRRRNVQIRKTIVYVVLGLIVMAALIGILYIPALNIQTIQIEGNEVVLSDQISSVAKQFLTGEYGYLIPKSNFLFYPKKKIQQQLLSEFPRIGSLVIKTSSLSSMSIVISERKPTSLWCDGEPSQHSTFDTSRIKSLLTASTTSSSTNQEQISSNEVNDGGCYFLDVEGYIFSVAPDFQGNSYIKFYGGTLGTTTIGSHLMSSTTYNQITTLVSQMQQNNLQIEYITLQDEGNFAVKIAHNGSILFNSDNSLTDEFDNLTAALTSNVLQSTTKDNTKKLNQFDYIDTRFGNKVFYKLSGSESLPQNSTTTPVTVVSASTTASSSPH